MRALVVSLLLLCAVAPSAAAKGKKKQPPIQRTEAVVLTGAQLPTLLKDDNRRTDLIAYRWKTRKGKGGRWVRIAVQVDQRAQVDFGQNPANGSVPLTGDKTIYGTPPIGRTTLAYTDFNTFVGTDPQFSLDADDEVAFMASDAGSKAPKGAGQGPGAVGKPVAVRVRDPIDGKVRWAYISWQTSKKSKLPRFKSHVRYAFNLTSGDYKTTYKRRDGPNPESSFVTTDDYTVGFSDRWFFDQLRIKAGGASGAEILDGYKFAFSSGGCGRSEATFNEAEGAFIANIDGPVRAIRSYVGANSGPYTQRTHYLYESRHQIDTELRVHPVPGPFTHYDLSPEAAGMTYLNQLRQTGAPVDGAPDGISGGPVPRWNLWRGQQGSFFLAERVETSIQASFEANLSFFHEDNSSAPSFAQCWGDADLIGAAGLRSTTSIPNTDVGASDFLRARSTNVYAPPGESAANAELWSQQLDRPLQVSAKRFK